MTQTSYISRRNVVRFGVVGGEMVAMCMKNKMVFVLVTKTLDRLL